MGQHKRGYNSWKTSTGFKTSSYDLFSNKYIFSHDFSLDPQDAHQLSFSGNCGELLGFSEKIFSEKKARRGIG